MSKFWLYKTNLKNAILGIYIYSIFVELKFRGVFVKMSTNINLLGINLAGGITLGVAFVALLLLLVMYSVWGISRVLSIPNNKTVTDVKMGRMSVKTVIAFIFVVGILVRVATALLFVEKNNYTDVLLNQFNTYKDQGFKGFQLGDRSNTFYPLAYLINGLFGTFGNLFGSETLLAFSLRLPLIIADVCSAVILYFIARKYINKQVATIVSALFLLNPMFYFNSSMAGQLNSLLTLSLLITFYFMATRRTFWMLFFYGVSLMIHRDAQILLVPMAVYSIYLIVRSYLAIRREGRSGMKSDATKNGVWVVPVSIIGVFAIMWLVCLPFVANSMGYNPFKFLNTAYIQMLKTYDNYGVDALSLYNIFLRNGEVTAVTFPALQFGIVFLVLATLISVILFLSKRNRANMVLIASFVMFTIGIYFINFTASTLVPSVAVLLLSYVFIKDRRLLKIYALMSICVVLNMLASVVKNDLLNAGFGFVINVTLSVIVMLVHIYFTIVVLDICMSSNIVALNTDPEITFSQANKNWLRIRRQRAME